MGVRKRKRFSGIEDLLSSVNKAISAKKDAEEDFDPSMYEGEDDDSDDYTDDFRSDTIFDVITSVEMAIINNYLYSNFKSDGDDDIKVHFYGETYLQSVSFSSNMNDTNPYWFLLSIKDKPGFFIVQTISYFDTEDRLVTKISMSTTNGYEYYEQFDLLKEIQKTAFINSKYVNKYNRVSIRNGHFDSIEVIPVTNVNKNLILSEEQKSTKNRIISRLKRGSGVRALLNGVPGSGKTEMIRSIVEELSDTVTFIEPVFERSTDLMTILESCSIFDNPVIIMDDIDLLIGSRDTNGATTSLGPFLSFFDGVKKTKVSLIASTNDKTMVDKAAERPGRFNIVTDFSYMNVDDAINLFDIMSKDEKWLCDSVIHTLKEPIDGCEMKMTGAFITNLVENIKEIQKDYDEEGIELTDVVVKGFIRSSYKGFYMNQSDERKKLGFSYGN